jgi:hypothetical protein
LTIRASPEAVLNKLLLEVEIPPLPLIIIVPVKPVEFDKNLKLDDPDATTT